MIEKKRPQRDQVEISNLTQVKINYSKKNELFKFNFCDFIDSFSEKDFNSIHAISSSPKLSFLSDYKIGSKNSRKRLKRL
jgi:hypothetical protein